MHILIGLAAAVALLWFWLCGGWFARILAFFVLGGALGVIIGGITPPQHGEPYNWGAFWIGVVLGWPVSGLPRYFQRFADRRIQARLAANQLPIIRL